MSANQAASNGSTRKKGVVHDPSMIGRRVFGKRSDWLPLAEAFPSPDAGFSNDMYLIQLLPKLLRTDKNDLYVHCLAFEALNQRSAP